MNRLLSVVLTVGFTLSIVCLVTAAEIRISGDMELFYERSEDIGGDDDDDQFKTNQLYVTFDGHFEEGLGTRLKLDGADVENSDGKNVTHKTVEEANFFFEDIGQSPVTLVFGKDEMPYGLDYDKYLTESLAHGFETDKVWGVHAIVKIKNAGDFAAAFYEHRNGSPENELTDNFTTRLTVDELVENLLVEFSFGIEEYVDSSASMDDEMRYSAGLIYKFIDRANVNIEYNGFRSRNGMENYDPGLVTLGVECKEDKYKIFGRYERIIEDADTDVEENFFMIGTSYSPADRYTLSLEYSNFNTENLKDAGDLNVADDSLEDSIKFGIRAIF